MHGSAALLASCFVLGCGAAQAPHDEPAFREPVVDTSDARDEFDVRGREPTPQELTVLREAMRVAETLRSLRFVRPVPVRVQSQQDIVAFMHGRIEERELAEARHLYVALGLLEPDVDVRALVVGVMGEQVVGLYDPRRHLMVVRDDVLDELSRERARGAPLMASPHAMVLVHEYVHALQDQRLGVRLEDQARSNDESNAYAALVEGDATLAMLGASLSAAGRNLRELTQTPGLLRRLLPSEAAAAPPGSELAGAPAILRVPLLSRYFDGLLFAAALHGRQHAGFSAIDAAFSDPPTTTEHILHPERYFARERPALIELPAFEAMRSGGFFAMPDETLGELEASIFFARGRNVEREPSAAAGWHGDRIRVWHRPPIDERTEALAFVWFSAWDNENEALEAELAARRVAMLPPSPAGPMVVTRRGRALGITAGLLPEAQREADAALAALAVSLDH